MSDPVLEDLKAQIAARRAVLVVGSGASIAATGNAPVASWTGLLKDGITRCVALDSNLAGSWEERALADITSGRMDDLLAGASKVARTLRRQGEWQRWLADSVGKLRASRTELLATIGGLDAPIVTTNYDDLLERQLNRQAITWRDDTEQIAFARLESRDTILHLHGFWMQPDSVILDAGDYERVVGSQLAQAGLRTLGEAWSLVFVGCGDGLSDPNFDQFLDWMGTVLRGARHRHFRLERQMDVERRQALHVARRDRVRVVPYGDAYDDLPAFLESLKPRASPSPASGITASSVPVSKSKRPVLTAGEYLRLQAKGREATARLSSLAQHLRWQSIAAHGEELSKMLEEDLYRVAITGKSRAGKSTLVNALVGRNICPVERVLTTAIPIIIGPGATESATITFGRSPRPPVIPLDAPVTADMLAPYADQRHNPNNKKGVERIEVRLGHQVLDLGVEYVDIPGFDDPSGKIWTSTHQVLDRAHALVLILDISPFAHGGFALDKTTRDVLKRAQARGCPILVVCNKADTLTRGQRDEAAAYLNELLTVHGLAGALPRPPFFVSAKEAADARTRGEDLPSPFAAFEEALWDQLWHTESVGMRRLFKVELLDFMWVPGEEGRARFRRSKDGSWPREPGRYETRMLFS